MTYNYPATLIQELKGITEQDCWDDVVSELVDAAFETVSRNPSDHEQAFAYRRAILWQLRNAQKVAVQQP